MALTTSVPGYTEGTPGQFAVYVNGLLVRGVTKAAGGRSGFARQVLVDGDGVKLQDTTLYGDVEVVKHDASVVPTETLGGLISRYGKLS
jgi:hypothetical protein